MDRLEELRKRFEEEPLVVFLKAELRVLGDGRAVVVALVRPEFTIVGGAVQGGIIATLADYAGVYAAMTRIPDGHTPAMQMNIRWLRPVTAADGIVWASAYVENESKTVIDVRVDVRGEGSKCKAVASIVFSKPK